MKLKQTNQRCGSFFQRVALTMVMSLFCVVAFAQKTITGTVVDTNGEPVIGASVMAGKGTGTVTDFNGKFTLKVAENGTIKVSYVGYETQTVSVAGKSDFQITLKEDATTLDDVVVIGYGSVKKRNLTAAVAKMDDKGIRTVRWHVQSKLCKDSWLALPFVRRMPSLVQTPRFVCVVPLLSTPPPTLFMWLMVCL